MLLKGYFIAARFHMVYDCAKAYFNVEFSMTSELLSLDAAKLYIERIELGHVVERMMREYNWPRRTLLAACEQYRHFLWLVKKYDQEYQLTPSKEVDEVWHNHILFTEQYNKDCNVLFGRYFHHRPSNTPESLSHQLTQMTPFNKTQELHKAEFGTFIYTLKPNCLQRGVIYVYRRLINVFKVLGSYIHQSEQNVELDNHEQADIR